MKKIYLSLLMSVPLVSMAQNPVIRDQFSADPTARVFNNRVYLYPSHDIMPPAGQRSYRVTLIIHFASLLDSYFSIFLTPSGLGPLR